MADLKLNYSLESRLEVFYTGGCVRMSADESRTACACHDEVKIIDNASGRVVQTIPGDTEPVTALLWGLKDEFIFVASRSLQFRMFSVDSGNPIRSFRGHKAPVAEITIDSSGTLLASCSADKSIKVWDIEGGYCTHSFTGHRGIVLCCTFHPSQLLLLSGGDDSQIKIWDLVTKSCISTLQSHFSAVTSISISENGWTMASGGRDGVVIVWNLRNYSKIATVPVYEAVECVAILPHTFYSSLKLNKRDHVVFSTGGEKGQVKIWRSDTATCISTELPGMPEASTAGAIVEIRGSFSEKSHFELLAATQDCRLLLLSLQEEKIGLHRQFIGNSGEVTDVRFLPPLNTSSPSYLAISTNGEQIHIIDSQSMSCRDTLSGHKEAVLCLDTVKTRNGFTLLASGSKDMTVRVWKIEDGTGSCLSVGTGHVGPVTSLVFSQQKAKDDFLISAGSDKLLRLWDTSNLDYNSVCEQLPVRSAIPAHDKEINAVAVSPNDAYVASASQDKLIKIWKLPDLVLSNTLKGHKRGVWSVSFSPVDQALVSASGDKTLRLWNLKDGSCLRTFEGHTSSVLQVNFLSAGTQLLTAGADGLIKLWNIRMAEAIATFDAHEDKVWALALQDSVANMVASGGADGSVAIWKDCTDSDRIAAAQEAEDVALKEQDLDNAIHSGEWREAAKIAIDMNRPGQLLRVFQRALNLGPESSAKIFVDVSKSLDIQQTKTCLEYCREWNTHSKHCAIGQALLNAILKTHSQSDLISIPGCSSILDGIEAYTTRHLARIDRLSKSSFIVDFILGVMGSLVDSEERQKAESNYEFNTRTPEKKTRKRERI